MFAGWQWEAVDRPMFKDIHNALETMFQNSSISEGTISHLCLDKVRVLTVDKLDVKTYAFTETISEFTPS